MADIVALQTATKPIQPVDQSVIDMLSTLLKRAEEGEIQGLAFVTVSAEASGALACCGSGYAGQALHQNVHASLGAVDVLHERMLRSLVQWEA